MLERMWRKGNPGTLLVGMQTGAATVENSMEFNCPLTQQFRCFGYILRTLKHQSKKPVHPNVHSSTIYNSQVGSNLHAHQQVSGSKTMVYLNDGILQNRKKEGAPILCDSWMELESIMLS